MLSIDQFAQLYSDRLGIKEEVLRKTLWGDWYLDAKNKVSMVWSARHIGQANVQD